MAAAALRHAAIPLVLAWAIPANAASTFQIAPTTLNLEPGRAGLLYLSNNSATSAVLQIQPMDWTQDGSTDSLAPSDTLFASPPLLRIAPGERQTVRVLAEPTKALPEAAYRLVVSQLPLGAKARATVSVLLQFNIPVFVAAAPAKPAVAWSIDLRAGRPELWLQNNGLSTVKLTALALSQGNGVFSSVPCGLTYVLPGARHNWNIPLGDVSSVHVAARDERSGVSLDADIAVPR